MTPAQLDQHIACCARLMEAAMEKGDRAEAVAWQQAMYAAIDADPCYFCAMGEADRARLGVAG